MLLAEVIESVADIHYRDLAAAVGVDLPHGRVTSDEGLRITDILNKRDPARHPVRPGRPTDGPS